VALEHVAVEAKYPCVFRKYGCTEIYSFRLIGEHQEKCQYNPQSCPVNKLKLGVCAWTGLSSNMMLHLMQAHNDVCVDYYGPGSLFTRGPFQISGVTPATKHSKLIFAYNNTFYSCSEIKNDIFYSVLQYIGPAADAAKYHYKLELFNKESRESLAVTLLARSLDEDLREVYNSGQCVKLYPQQYNRFENERGELTFSMEIIMFRRNCRIKT
jgi:hypothetical protein